MPKFFNYIIQYFNSSTAKKKELGALYLDPDGRLIYDYVDGYGKVETLVEVEIVKTQVRTAIYWRVSNDSKPQEGLKND
jgi:hypothetical protein